MIHLKGVNFGVCELYLKAVILKQNKNLRSVGALAIPTWRPASSSLGCRGEPQKGTHALSSAVVSTPTPSEHTPINLNALQPEQRH